MSSTALRAWRSARAERLNRLQTAHATVGGSGPGRRWLTEELNHALVLRLAAEFQGFTRELHDEASMAIADTLSAGVSPRRGALGRALTSTRRLNRGNATAEVLAHDFGLLGLLLWDELQQRFGSAHQWRDRLRLLNEARNGLAHADQQKLDRVAGSGWPLTPRSARRWRGTLDALATGIDRVTGDHLRRVFGVPDW